MSERVQTLHPELEKTAPRILLWKYDAVREALLRAVPKKELGIPFKELPARVRSLLG